MLVAGCQRQQESAAPTTATTATTATIPVETTEATTTTTLQQQPKALGVTQTFTDDDGTFKVTVFRYRDSAGLPDYLDAELKREGLRDVVAEVRVCVTKVTAPDFRTIPLGWEPWSLGDDGGSTYEAWSSYSDDVRPLPLYPDGKETPAGRCRRGWLPFEIAHDARPTFIEYNPGGAEPLKWPIKR